ncbi:MAG: hypothetical protein JWM16_301 [Verrucomicrobiales bacterium]|nr:hypothetical protein [Verrucomicrobiales bacterium]
MKTELKNKIRDSGKQNASPGCNSIATPAAPTRTWPGSPDQTHLSDQSDVSCLPDSPSLDEFLLNPGSPFARNNSHFSHSVAKHSPTHRNALSRVITGCHAFARIKNLEPKPSKPALSRDVFLPDSFVPEAPAIQACTRPDKAKQASKKMRKQALFTSLAWKASLLRPVAIRQPFARSRNIGKLQSGNVRNYQETSFLKDQRSQEMSGFVRKYQVIPHTALIVRKYQEILPPVPGDVTRQFRIAGTAALRLTAPFSRFPRSQLFNPRPRVFKQVRINL